MRTAEIASEREELEREHLQLELNWQQAEEALHAAKQSGSSDDDSYVGVAILKDVLREYGAITDFPILFLCQVRAFYRCGLMTMPKHSQTWY